MNKILGKIIKAFGIVITIISVLIIGAVVVGHILLCPDSRMSKKEIIKYVTENREEINAAVSSFIREKGSADGITLEKIDIPKCDGIKGVNFEEQKFYPIDNARIKFYCGGYGMGSETGYAGFYYSLVEPKNELTGLINEGDMSFLGYYSQGYTAIGQVGGHGSGNSKFKADGNGWRWKEAGGDNTVYIEHIIDGFYYYLEEY